MPSVWGRTRAPARYAEVPIGAAGTTLRYPIGISQRQQHARLDGISLHLPGCCSTAGLYLSLDPPQGLPIHVAPRHGSPYQVEPGSNVRIGDTLPAPEDIALAEQRGQFAGRRSISHLTAPYDHMGQARSQCQPRHGVGHGG